VAGLAGKELELDSQSDAHRLSLDQILIEWSKAGSRLGPSHAARCVIRSCRFMAYVALKTDTVNQDVCLKHFERLNRLNDRVA